MIVSNDMTRDSRVDRHAKALAYRGHEVVVLCRASSKGQPRYENRRYYVLVRYFENLLNPRVVTKPNTMNEVDSPSHFKRTIFKYFNATRLAALAIATRLWLYSVAFKIRANVYHCNDLDTLDIGAIMKIARKKLVYDSHELYVDQITQSPLKTLYLAFEKLFLKLADVIITVNPFIANQLQERYHIKKRIQVVLSCPETFCHPSSQPTDKNRSDLVTVLYHGGLYPERGLEGLIRASRYFHKGTRLLIRGDGELEDKLRQLASGLPNIVFEKSVPMNLVVEAAADADIGIIAYLPTNLNHLYCSPNKLFEYIQAGLAVVTSDLPFLRQIVVGNDIGVVFNPYDPCDIAEKINFASDRNNLLDFKRTVQKIRYRYTWEYEKSQLYTAYKYLETSNHR